MWIREKKSLLSNRVEKYNFNWINVYKNDKTRKRDRERGVLTLTARWCGCEINYMYLMKIYFRRKTIIQTRLFVFDFSAKLFLRTLCQFFLKIKLLRECFATLSRKDFCRCFKAAEVSRSWSGIRKPRTVTLSGYLTMTWSRWLLRFAVLTLQLVSLRLRLRLASI